MEVEITVEGIEGLVSEAEKRYGEGRSRFIEYLIRAGYGEEEAEKLYKMEHMFRNPHKRVIDRLPADMLHRYKLLYYYLMLLRSQGRLPVDRDYLGGNSLAESIFKRAYFLKTKDGEEYIETRPEDLFLRVAAFIAAAEKDLEKGAYWAERFYRAMYNGILSPAGRIRTGAGDLYRLKTLSNCYFLQIEDDSIEGIWKTSYQMARTYSYGGGVGTDVSPLRPSGSPVHNASNTSTGPTSFMYLYSLTTGIIGQEGRRGALMITIDVKHPDVIKFIRVKRDPDWWTNMIMNEIRMSGKFTEDELKEIERAVINNVQIRFANISVKFTDEFFMALEEQDKYGSDKVLLYRKKVKGKVMDVYQDRDWHYSYGIPSKDPNDYELEAVFDDVHSLNRYLRKKYGVEVLKEALGDPMKRDVYGDYVIEIDAPYDLAVRYSGDFLLYFGSSNTGSIKRLVKARDIWNVFVESNWKSAEPGLIFWSQMTRYSPSNYIGIPIMGTNPCGEVPLEHGGACVLSSLNLLSFVDEPLTPNASFNWRRFKEAVTTIVRFLDNVVEWNIHMHPLEDQRKAMAVLRRIGAGVLGLADMLIALGMEYDSDEAIAFVEKVMRTYMNEAYRNSALIAEEKGTFPLWDFEKWSKNPYYPRLDPDVQEIIREKGLRNVTVMAIAPTGNTSNSTLALRLNGKNYVGLSSGIEPVFALYYIRRTEAIEKDRYFKVFHPIAQAYLDLHGLNEAAQMAKNEEDLKKILPPYFFRTAHVIDPLKRVEIQGVIQRWVDGSISSTVNLPEDIHPEVVGDIYRAAWKHGLKGITVYREGSRFAVLITDGKKTEFQEYKDRKFKVYDGDRVYEVFGDTVIVLPDGRLSTVYHAIKEGILRPRSS